MTKPSQHSPIVSIQNVLSTLPDSPLATTRGRNWDGVTLDMHATIHGYSLQSPAHDHHVICYCPSGKGRLVQMRDGVTHSSVMSKGMSLLMPAGMESDWEGVAASSARLRIPLGLIAAAAEQMGSHSTNQYEICNVFETRDPMIARMARVLMVELDQPAHPGQYLLAESVSCALAAHMLRAYNGFEPPARPRGSLLGGAELAKLTEFIEENLDQPISLADLAEIVNVSRFHFSRIFKQSMGVTPISFVEQSRIRRAQFLIAESELSLAEVALDTGFADQSHFTRRFRMHVGCTPASFARERGRRRPARHGSH